MSIRVIFCSIICSLCLSIGFAAENEEAVERAARIALDHMIERETPGGGWASAWSVDGELAFGQDREMPGTWITVQPPATPAIGRVMLRASAVLDDPRYFEAARRARSALLILQTDLGGFPHEDDPSDPRRRYGTFDDHVTTGALAFLIAYAQHTGDDADMDAVRRVGDFLIAAQYPIGGYPQAYPPRVGHYQEHITFNDGNMVNIVRALLRLHEVLGEERYRAASLRAGECMLKLQGGAGEAIWAQQYDSETLEPAWARNFEPPGYTPNESGGVCDLLIALYRETGDARYLDAVERALAWYRAHRGDDGLYPRLLEPGTGRPVYGRRDKAVKVYEFENATAGYSWRGDWYPHAAERALGAIRSGEVGAPAAGRGRPGLEAVMRIVDAMHAEGYWTESPNANQAAALETAGVAEARRMVVKSGTFARNVGVLLDYLAEE